MTLKQICFLLATLVISCGNSSSSTNKTDNEIPHSTEISDSEESNDSNSTDHGQKPEGTDEDINSEKSDAETTDEQQCRKVTLEEIASQSPHIPTYFAGYTPNTGSSDRDKFFMIFRNMEGDGEFDLGKGLNRNFSTCEQCVLILEDQFQEGEDVKAKHYYFQESGTMKIDYYAPCHSGKDELSGESVGSIKNVKLVEVKLDEETKTTTVVDGGGCIEIEYANWDTKCIPNCVTEDGKQKICGDDGCGRSCGDPCTEKGLSCSEDGTSCVDKKCTGISIDDFKYSEPSAQTSSHLFEGSFTPEIGLDDRSDIVRIQLYDTTPGRYDLATGKNTNYRTCDQCITIDEDDNGEFVVTRYFQDRGTMTVENDGKLKGKVVKARLVEVEIDKDFNSKPVVNGKCLEIEAGQF